MTRNDPQALNALGELLNQHGTLAWMQRGRASFKGFLSEKALSATGAGAAPARRVWWIAIPLAACLLVTVGIIRFGPVGTLPVPKPNLPDVPAVKPEWRTLSFQDGSYPSADYRGTRDTRLIERESAERRGPEPLPRRGGGARGRPAAAPFARPAVRPGRPSMSLAA